MAHYNCPSWNYESRPSRKPTLLRQVGALLQDLRHSTLDTLASTKDTRPIHSRLFNNLTPSGFQYYAGNYRGSPHLCLLNCEVEIDGMPGCPASQVDSFMTTLASIGDRTITDLDSALIDQSAVFTQGDRIRLVVAISAELFTLFLTIHPYRNGNGHIGRFIIWAILARYGLWIHKWPIEPRPQDPPYTQLVQESINGNPEPLEKHIIQRLSP